MKNIKILFIGMIIMLLSGCFQIENVIKVNKDGSGTIENTVIFSQDMLKMSMSFQSSSSSNNESAYHDIEKLKKEALKIGDNVKYVKSKPIKLDTKIGYSVVYSFPDITKIKISENPASTIMNMSQNDEEIELIKFNFKKGNNSELTISFPQNDVEEYEKYIEYEDDEEYEDAVSQVSDRELEMMKKIYKDMKISFKIIVDGKIVKTNANFADKNEVILSDIDFNTVMENKKAFKTLIENKDVPDDVIKSKMQNLPGFKIDTNKEIFIRFK